MSLPIELLDRSFELIRPRVEDFAASFYINLFHLHPQLKPFFAKTDMVEQRKMLMGALVLAINNIHKPEQIATTLKRLGGRHIKYGASLEYYPLFGEALLTTLEDYLGSDWTEEVEKAWFEAYHAITELMLTGAQEQTDKQLLYDRVR